MSRLVVNGGFTPHAASSEMFSPNAIGVGAINTVPTFAPTPMASGLNVKPLIRDRARYNFDEPRPGVWNLSLRSAWRIDIVRS